MLEETYNKLTNANSYKELCKISNFQASCGELYEYLHGCGFSDNMIMVQLLLPIGVIISSLGTFTKEDLITLLKQDNIGQTILNSSKSEEYVNQLYGYMVGGTGEVDSTSIDFMNADETNDYICLTTNIDYLVSCIEMNLAQEYKVINFDFYND